MTPASTKKKLKHVSSLLIILGVVVLSGCRQSPPEVRSLLSFQDDWGTAKNEKPYLADIAHEIVARTDSLRQSEVAQVLAKKGINDIVALLEYESPGGNLKGVYTVFVIARRSVYRIRIFDHGRDVTKLAILKSEVLEAAKCIDALRGYKGNDIPAACDLDMVFVTTYKNKKAATMFFAYMMTLDAKRTWAKHGSPQGRIFYRLCEILLLAPSGDVTSEMTDVSYPRFWKEYGK